MGKSYRNPVIYAQELQTEMVQHQLTRRGMAERCGVSSDRITQWLLLLELPESILEEVIALGDQWARRIITESRLKTMRGSRSLIGGKCSYQWTVIRLMSHYRFLDSNSFHLNNAN